jgi:hypothetical protein
MPGDDLQQRGALTGSQGIGLVLAALDTTGP